MATACGYTTAVIVLCHTLLLASASNDCSPPIQNCSCIEGTLNCQGLTKLPAAVPVDITEFIFDKCVLGDLTQVLYDHAEVLLIRDSGLTDIADGALQSLASLKTLDLSTNELVSVRKEMFRGLTSLTDLSLRSNGIKAITDDTFANLPNLTSVNLNGNPGLHVSDNVFGTNKRLKHVHLSRCELETVPIIALSTVATLTTLELDWNPLGTIPSLTFAKLTQLQTLNLFSCSLTSIADDAFAGLDQLFVLNLAENELTEIPDGAFDNCCHALQNLYLNDNELTSLPGGVSVEGASRFNWQNVRSLKLGGNPWTCDCDLQWMRALDLDRIDHENLTCAEPDSMSGHNLHEAIDTLSCDASSGGSSAVALGIAIPVIIICLILIAFFVFKIMQTRRQRAGKKSVRYSEVYKDTVETTPRAGTQQPLSVL